MMWLLVMHVQLQDSVAVVHSAQSGCVAQLHHNIYPRGHAEREILHAIIVGSICTSNASSVRAQSCMLVMPHD